MYGGVATMPRNNIIVPFFVGKQISLVLPRAQVSLQIYDGPCIVKCMTTDKFVSVCMYM